MRPVLVVDDEAELAAAVMTALQRHGFESLWVTSLAGARERLDDVELVLLDLGLPDGDGLDACAEFAKHVPVIVISARGEEVDRVLALELGADDYLAKPFSSRELVARCRAVLRRSGSPRTIVRAADLDIDVDAFEVHRDSTAIELTGKEMALLALLARHHGTMVRRSAIASAVWDADLGYVQRSIDVHVSSLRAKLGSRPDGLGYIETIRGIGYRLRR
ncbi:MAG: chemotaxis protein CheY [Ilumatobacteraceae bacterium]|nr:chemotaxis protein CheY [Ilumatobacteraceae bacterium]